jgi:glycosyltransferase involved in cell wall biosynthesis
LPAAALKPAIGESVGPTLEIGAPFRLLCAARYGQLGASSRLRLAQYIPWLEQAGIRTTMRAFLSNNYVRALYEHKPRLPHAAAAYVRALTARHAARAHDLLWIEKEFLPWLPYWLERLAIGGKPYVLDFDDAWSLRYERSSSALIRAALGKKFQHLLRGAALTITANQTLYDWAAQSGARNLLLLPTVIDLDHYKPTPEPTGPFTICWVGTPVTATYLQAIAEPLRTLAQESPLKLLIIGAPDANIPGVVCDHANWTEATEAALIGQAHAGIMPLPDDEWARGKSGYKLIQYMAMGRPTIGSPIGANQTIVEHGHTGFLATTNEEWLTALRALRDNPTMRANMGRAARTRVEHHFALQVTAPILIQALENAVRG